MYITIWKVYRDRLGFNQVVKMPKTETSVNRASRNDTMVMRIARRSLPSKPEGRVFCWSNI